MVHGVTDSYEGSANKNVGDAFLLSWSIDMKGEEIHQMNKLDIHDVGSLSHQLPNIKTDMADKALFSVQKMCAIIAEETQFVDGISPKRIHQLNMKKLIHVRLGFGLHFGRAVQGAIGSDRKLDVTYISSNVELAEWCEGSTKTYGVNLLMTKDFQVTTTTGSS